MPPLGHRSGLDSGSMEAHAAAESMVSMLVQYCSQSFFKKNLDIFLSNNYFNTNSSTVAQTRELNCTNHLPWCSFARFKCVSFLVLLTCVVCPDAYTSDASTHVATGMSRKESRVPMMWAEVLPTLWEGKWRKGRGGGR